MDVRNYDSYSDDKIINGLINNDDKIIDYFFYHKCTPLLNKLSSTILKGIVDTDDLRQELFIILSSNDWKSLKEFKYNSTLMGWIKVISANLCVKLRKTEDKAHLEPIYSSISKQLAKLSTDILIDSLKNITNPISKAILQEKYISKEPDESIMLSFNLTTEQYKTTLHAAEKKLLNLIKEETESTNIISYQYNSKEILGKSLSFEDQVIAKLDIKTLIREISNDRYRYIIDSIMVQGKSIDELSKELDMRPSNIYNIKHRALIQLATIARKNK